jgi:hypothetical protein
MVKTVDSTTSIEYSERRLSVEYGANAASEKMFRRRAGSTFWSSVQSDH